MLQENNQWCLLITHGLLLTVISIIFCFWRRIVLASTNDKRMPTMTSPYKYLLLRLLQTPLFSHWTLPLMVRVPLSRCANLNGRALNLTRFMILSVFSYRGYGNHDGLVILRRDIAQHLEAKYSSLNITIQYCKSSVALAYMVGRSDWSHCIDWLYWSNTIYRPLLIVSVNLEPSVSQYIHVPRRLYFPALQ